MSDFKKLSNFTNLIKNFDIFGAKMNFRINSKKEHRTLCAGISTFFFFFFSLIYLLINFKAFVMRDNINMIFTNKILDSNPFLNLTSSQYAIAFSLAFQTNSTIATEYTEDLFDYSMNIVQWVGANDLTRFPVNLKRCEEVDFYNIRPDLFHMNGMDNMYCPDMTPTHNFTIAGLFTDVWFQFLELNINIKPKYLGNMNVIKDFMNYNPLYTTIYLLDTAIDYDNKTQPLPNMINYYYSTVAMNSYKLSEIYLSTLEFSSDDNFLFQEEHMTIDTILDRTSDFSIQIDDRDELHSMNPTNALGLSQFIIKASPKYFIVKRIYQKLPDFLAKMSGLISQVLFLLMFTVNYTNQKSAENKIMSKVLKYKGKKDFDIKNLTEVFGRKDPRTNNNNNKLPNMISGNIHQTEINGNIGNKINNGINGNIDELPSEPAKKLKTRLLRINSGSMTEENNFLPKVQNFSHVYVHKISHLKNENIIREINLKEINEIISNNNHINNNSQERSVSAKSNEGESESSKDKSASDDEEIILNYDLFEKKKRLSLKTTKFFVETNVKKKDLHFDKEITKRLFKLNTFEILLIKMKCCCKRFKIRKKIIKAGEYKLFFYLDVLTYIKKMQEIDILKYLILNAEQLFLFNFLSKPSISTNDITSQVKTEFDEEQKRVLTMTKEEIEKMHECYTAILGQNQLSQQDKKLVNLIDAEIDCLKED